MMNADGRVVVGLDTESMNEFAVEWGVDAARARGVPLRMLCAYRWVLAYGSVPPYGGLPGDLKQRHLIAEKIVRKAVTRARELCHELDVEGEAVEGDAIPVLIEESRRAGLLVLGSRDLTVLGSIVLGSVSAAAAARAHCPTVVLRGPAGLPAEDPAVVVGVDGTEADEAVLGFAFDHASWHCAPLRAVLCWRPDTLASMSWRLEPPAPAKAELWLSEALAGWREKFPDVTLHSAVTRAHPVPGLVAEALNQRLLVVGNRGRHALAGTLLGSVSQGVLHHALCPVAVIPGNG